MYDFSIFKRPSIDDYSFIEGLISKYGLEVEHVAKVRIAQPLFSTAKTPKDISAIKCIFPTEFFPITHGLWICIFYIINQKISQDLLPQLIERETGLALDMCNTLAAEILANELIQQEIQAITLEKNTPEDASGEIEDEIKREIENIETLSEDPAIDFQAKTEKIKTEKVSGVGQEFFK